jgi:hypothetical protein
MTRPEGSTVPEHCITIAANEIPQASINFLIILNGCVHKLQGAKHKLPVTDRTSWMHLQLEALVLKLASAMQAWQELAGQPLQLHCGS